MAASGSSSLAGDDYVVRYGLRGFFGALGGLVIWTGFASVIAAYDAVPSVTAAIALAAGEIGLLAGCAVEIWRAARRHVVFAVHEHGVYFGSGQLKEDIPWDLICAVELFAERASSHGIRSRYRCVGVRAPGAFCRRPGGGPAARKAAHAVEPGAVLEAERTGREASAPPGIRLACRRMRGWRVSPARLEAAVSRYAPDTPVLIRRG